MTSLEVDHAVVLANGLVGELGEALSGAAGAAGIARAVIDPRGHGADELLTSVVGPGRLALVRSKYKPSGKLTGYYELAAGDSRRTRRHVAVTWSLVGDSIHVSVLASPDDPAMPQLTRLHDLDHVHRALVDLDGIRWPDSPEDLLVRTVRYRPGQRHVLHVRAAGARTGVYLKTDPRDRARHAVQLAGVLRTVPGLQRSTVGVVPEVGYLAAESTAVWREVQGPLLRRLLTTDPAAVPMLAALGRGLRAVHEHAELEQPAELARAAVHREVAATARAGEHITRLLPTTGRVYAALLHRVADHLERLPAGPVRLVHGDLKTENVVAVSGRRVRLLDLDRAGWGDPALDLAKLLADLRWWCAGDRRRAAVLANGFRQGYGRADQDRWARATLLATVFDLRYAARRVAVHDPRWQALVREQVERAARRPR
jgi:aminoglycoside phosphotransferase (APT) family kinase protein